MKVRLFEDDVIRYSQPLKYINLFYSLGDLTYNNFEKNTL